MGFVRAGANNSWLHLPRLLSRKLAYSRRVDAAPTQTHAAAW
jgi:hypothetical protein